MIMPSISLTYFLTVYPYDVVIVYLPKKDWKLVTFEVIWKIKSFTKPHGSIIILQIFLVFPGVARSLHCFPTTDIKFRLEPTLFKSKSCKILFVETGL